jgi:peptidoglycan/LPS O-acetylase OafA/YrhL
MRALAVIAVVLFHARLPVPGGFVGVDIFFVISGFVITGLLFREWEETRTVKFAQFYRRRFLRLTPALAIVVAFAILVSGFLMFPNEQLITIQTGIGALALVANVVIARTTGGYFDVPAESNPLLNTWSLSIEEQFYLIFPLILFLTWKIARRLNAPRELSMLVVSFVVLASFGLTLFSNTADGQNVTWLNFYSPAVRVWEFAVGSLLFLLLQQIRLPQRVFPTLLGATGVAGIVYSLFLITPATPFPSAWTLIPVVSTALLITAGSAGSNVFTSTLSTKPAVQIGDWSYSLYLWHWPIIVFVAFLGYESPLILAGAALFSLLPAIATFRWIETPIRNRNSIFQRNFLKTMTVVLSVPLLSALLVTFFIHSVDLYPIKDDRNYLDYITSNSVPCEIAQTPGNEARCRQTYPDQPIQIAVLGDSHAEHLYPGFINSFPDQNILYVFLPNWPYESSDNSILTVDQIAASTSINSVIISSRWVPTATEPAPLVSALDRFSGSGKQVFISTDNPYFSFHAQECKYERPLFFEPKCSEGATEFNTLNAANMAWLKSLSNEYPGVELIDTSSGFCTNESCHMTINDQLMYSDRGHLNVTGSRYIIDRLTRDDPFFRDTLSSETSP